MEYKINFENYKNNFSLPELIVGDDLKEINSDYLKLILLIFKNPDKEYSANLLSNLLNLSEQTVQEGIRYWISKSVLQGSTETSRPVQVISEKTPAPSVQPADGELQFLLSMMEPTMMRPVTSTDIRIITYIYESYRLPADVILMAIQYCAERGKNAIKFIETVCISWYDRGITNHALAEEFLKESALEKDQHNQIKQMFGIAGRSLIASEEKFIHTWFTDYHFDLDVIRLAFEKTIKNTGKVAFAYTNKILMNWNKKGYKNLQDVQEQEAGTRFQGASGSNSYDLDMLDEYWKNNVPVLDKKIGGE